MNPTALTLALLSGLAAPLLAQPTDEAPATEETTTSIVEDGDDIDFNFHASTIFYDEADFDDATGTIEAWRTSLGIGATMDAGDGRWSIGLDAEQTDYDFTSVLVVGGGGGGSGDVPPILGSGGGGGGGGGGVGVTGTFDDVTILTLSTSYHWQPDDNGNKYFVGGSVNAAYESGASFDDAISGTVFGGFRHQVNENLELGLGVVVKTRLEDDVLILPLPQIKYNMGNGWTFESQRVGAKLMYAASDSLSMGVTGEYESRSFRLDDTNTIPAGAATETRVPVAFQVDYKPNKTFSLQGRVGASFGSDLEFFNAAGNSVAQRDFDSSIFFGFGGTILF